MDTEIGNVEGQQPAVQPEAQPSPAEIPAQESTPAPQPESLTRAELEELLNRQARQFQSLVDKQTYKLRQEIQAAAAPYEQVLADPDIAPYLGEDGTELLRKKKLEAMGKVMSQQPEEPKKGAPHGVPIDAYLAIVHAHGLKDNDPDMAKIDPERFSSFEDWQAATVALANSKRKAAAPPKPITATPAAEAPPAAPVPVTVGLGGVRQTTGLAALRQQHKDALEKGDLQRARELVQEIAKLA